MKNKIITVLAPAALVSPLLHTATLVQLDERRMIRHLLHPLAQRATLQRGGAIHRGYEIDIAVERRACKRIDQMGIFLSPTKTRGQEHCASFGRDALQQVTT